MCTLCTKRSPSHKNLCTWSWPCTTRRFYLTQLLLIHESLSQPHVPPYRLLHPQWEGTKVFSIDVDSWNLLVYGATLCCVVVTHTHIHKHKLQSNSVKKFLITFGCSHVTSASFLSSRCMAFLFEGSSALSHCLPRKMISMSVTSKIHLLSDTVPSTLIWHAPPSCGENIDSSNVWYMQNFGTIFS